MVDECNSYSGCDVNNDYQPPCPYNVVAASKAVWVALGVAENSDVYGEMNVTWAPTNERINSVQRNNKKIIIVVVVVVVVVLGALGMVTLLVVCINKRKRSRKDLDEEQWENSLVVLSDFPKRFTYKELKLSTDNFNEQRKLGSGGFGSVFEGTLNDGVRTRIAVKRLDYVKQGKKEFLTEVKTTGNVHHFNLVKLVGFCAEKGHRLLVYDYMSNGSLEKWIFRDNNKGYDPLNWSTRKKIILHIAKGLSYLHEDCKSKILHLDIKPQNILLDSEFNAKLADFGLAKLIDKEESFAATQMRGTRGYLAPEWLSRKITEKVDVYSCGIVILEVVFQRRNFDVQDQDNPTLVEIVREKLKADRLFEAIEECCGDDEEMGENVEEVEKMFKVAIWCLQVDPTRRPSMSTVVKVLEGAIALEPIIDSTFANSTFSETSGDISSSNATLDMSSMTFPR